MTKQQFRIASIGLGWWSDVLADAVNRSSNQLKIVSCYTRSPDKREIFSQKYKCANANSYQEILDDPNIDGIINTSPNHVHLETTKAAANSGKHIFLDKPIANNVWEAKEITEECKKSGITLSIGYQRRRESHFRWIKNQIDTGEFGTLVQAEANISRDREGKFELGHWRYTADGMPGGVMLQIGLHYVDVLTMLLGPIKSVSGMASQLVLPGDNPDVGTLLMHHENGAISSLSTSYASASEYYLLNVYGKKMSAYYNLFDGLRSLRQNETKQKKIPVDKVDTLLEQLIEWADAALNNSKVEVGGESATKSLAVVLAGIKSAKGKRHILVDEIINQS